MVDDLNPLDPELEEEGADELPKKIDLPLDDEPLLDDAFEPLEDEDEEDEVPLDGIEEDSLSEYAY